MNQSIKNRVQKLEDRNAPFKGFKMGIYSKKKSKRLEKKGYTVVKITIREIDY